MRSRCKGLTVVETLIAAAILGMLTAVAIPQFAAPSQEVRETSLLSALQTFRSAIDEYWAQHETFPGQDGSEVQLVEQLCLTTTPAGRVGQGPAYRLGPYLSEGECPHNPFAGDNSVRVVDRMPSGPQGDAAWIYDRSSGEVRCNVAGATPDGTLYFEL